LESLWPKTFTTPKLRPPVAILKEQASLLGQATQNIIVATVTSETRAASNTTEHSFRIIAPALGNYRVLLFAASHKPIELYPLKIISEILAPEGKYYREWEVKDEAALKASLKVMFADTKTTKIIEALLAQSEGYTPPGPDDPPF
jgi:hypothetical protein